MNHPSKILIIDDDQSTVEIVSLILSSSGYDVSSETDGNMQFLTHKEFPDIILLDNKLGYEDGSDICRKLKQNDKTAHIPIILISAIQGIDDIACKAGADAFLAKPFSMQQLMDVISSLEPIQS